MRATTAAATTILILASTAPAAALDTTYQPGALIIPMDTDYQDFGMFEAYGLVHDLLKHGVPVDWVAAAGKTYAAEDFRASATDVRTSVAVIDHAYRGGPFVVKAAHLASAMPRVQAWQVAHPSVAVHMATEPFSAHVARELRNTPQVAVLVDGGEDDAFAYLNAAAIPMSDGNPWPPYRDRSGAYACPGTYCCPDCLDASRVAGATSNHADGAMFDAKGVPRYCQIASMDYPYPAPLPEVVAEMRAFLKFPVSFFAASSAVQAFENDAAGRFLTTAGLQFEGPSRTVDYYGSDDPSAQADGEFQNSGSGVAAFTVGSGSAYIDLSAVRVTKAGTPPGINDVFISGHMEGDSSKGKIAYLGGRHYETALPISARPKSQGTRYFLNSVFTAPCTAADGSPSMTVWLSGPAAAPSNPYALAVCYANAGPGIATDASLAFPLPAGLSVVDAAGATISASAVSWDLGSVSAGESVCKPLTLRFDSVGSFVFGAATTYRVGADVLTTGVASSLTVRFGGVNLLRFAVSSLAPQNPASSRIFTGLYPVDPTLDPVRDLEAASFASGASFPHDASDAAAGSAPLVYYQLRGSQGSTLRVAKSGGRIVITY